MSGRRARADRQPPEQWATGRRSQRRVVVITATVARTEQEVTVRLGGRLVPAVADLPPKLRRHRHGESVRVRLPDGARFVSVRKVIGLMRAQLSLFPEVTDV